MCAHLRGHVPMRIPCTNSTICSQCAPKLHSEPHRLSIQVASGGSISHSEPKGAKLQSAVHSQKKKICFASFFCKKQHGVFTESSQALNTQYSLYSKLLWQAYVRHNHSPKQIFSAIFFYFETYLSILSSYKLAPIIFQCFHSCGSIV